MISSAKTVVSAFVMLLAGAAQGCLASQADIDQAELGDLEEQGEVASTEEALIRGGSNQQRLGYSCTNGTCTCDKSIENDCEDMTAVCTDKTVDGVITCINGWLTTHCTCTEARAIVLPTRPIIKLNTAATLGSAAVLR